MAYVHRVVKAGPCVEHREDVLFSDTHERSTTGSEHGNDLREAGEDQRAESRGTPALEINANFGHRDLHAVLHYYDKGTTFEQFREDLKLFMKRLRKLCRKKESNTSTSQCRRRRE